GRPPATAEQIEQRRHAIVAAAYELFCEHGYQDTGIAQITERAGIGFGTFYSSYKTKRELLDDVVDHGLERALATIFGPAGDPGTQRGFVEQTRGAFDRGVALLLDEPSLARLIAIEIPAIDAEMRQRWLVLLDLGVAAVSGYIDHAISGGYIRD